MSFMMRRGINSSGLLGGDPVTTAITDAANLSAVSALLSTSDTSVFSASSNITVCVWAKFSSFSADHELLKSYDGPDQRSFLLYHTGTGMRFNVSSDGTADVGKFSTAEISGLSTDVWYFLVGRLDGTTLSVRATSVLTDSVSHTSGLHNSTEDFKIGRGDTDMILAYYYNRALSDAELDTLEAGGTPVCTDDLPPSLLVDLDFAIDMYGTEPLLDRSGSGIVMSNTDVIFTGSGISVSCT